MKLTDEQVEAEIKRLQETEEVKIAKKAYAIRNKRRQYLYNLRSLEKSGKALMMEGITLEYLERIDAALDKE